jgi:hypothetical protein
MLELEAGRVTVEELKAMMGRGQKSVRASTAEHMSPVYPESDRAPESAHASIPVPMSDSDPVPDRALGSEHASSDASAP